MCHGLPEIAETNQGFCAFSPNNKHTYLKDNLRIADEGQSGGSPGSGPVVHDNEPMTMVHQAIMWKIRYL